LRAWRACRQLDGGNAETYMDIGEAMGRGMVELIETSGGSSK
jgi:hypothetical protein